MNQPHLSVSLAHTSPFELRGHVENDDGPSPWIRAGADVTIFLNPPGTAFARSDILGNGRIYEDRVEIDLVLEAGSALSLADALGTRMAPRLSLGMRAISDSLFRIESVSQD